MSKAKSKQELLKEYDEQVRTGTIVPRPAPAEVIAKSESAPIPIESVPQKVELQRVPIPMGSEGFELNSIDACWRFAECCVRAGMRSAEGLTAEGVILILGAGAEVGLKPVQSMQNIYLVNGIPSIYGDAMLGIVRQSGQLEDFHEGYEGEGDGLTAVCTVKRKGFSEQVEKFSVADAKQAGLWGAGHGWKKFPKRMLRFRARSYALRDQFGDVLKGLHSVEEMEGAGLDQPVVRFQSDFSPKPEPIGELSPAGSGSEQRTHTHESGDLF